MNNNENKTPLFDENLPKDLIFEGVKKEPDNIVQINKRRNIPVSPYIVKLESKEETVSASPKLDLLARDLMLSVSDLYEEDSLEEDDDLLVDFNDLIDQLKDPEFNTRDNFSVDSEMQSGLDNPISCYIPEIDRLNQKINIDDLVVVEESDKPIQEKILEVADDNITIHFLKNESNKEEYDYENDVSEYDINREEPVLEIDTDSIKIKLQKRKLFRLRIPIFVQAHHRALAAFVLFAMIVITPLQIMQGVAQAQSSEVIITENGSSALDNLMRGAKALENNRYNVAESNFLKASGDFVKAEESIDGLYTSIVTLARIVPKNDKTLTSISGLIETGRELSDVASLMSNAASELQSQNSILMGTKLAILNNYISLSLPKVINASDALNKVNPSVVPEEYRNTVIDLKNKVPSVAISMQEFLRFSGTLLKILGNEKKMKYLVAFQNNTELRPTGGFIGSFAEMDIFKGEIDNIYIPKGGSYDVQGQLTEFVASPRPLSLLSPRWEFQDANWFPNFPTSAKKMLWFYDKSGGPTVDGLITINATFMPEILKITGPIEMKKYNLIIDSENFLFETQKIVELDYSKYQDEGRIEDAPKQFIGDLAPLVLEKMKNLDMNQMLMLADLIGRGLYNKDIMFYFEDNELQSEISKLGWSGELKKTTGDYLMVVNTNLGGGKTDGVIKQDIDIKTVILDDGTIQNTVTIVKQHKGLKSEIFAGKNNVDYLRLYVPKGSKLIEANGFKIPTDELFKTSLVPLKYDDDLSLVVQNVRKDPESETDIWTEDGKTVFGNWMQTAPGETETVIFKYNLPWKLKDLPNDNFIENTKSKIGLKNLDKHTILIQKQSGVNTRSLTMSLELPHDTKLIWSSHSGVEDAKDIFVSGSEDTFIRFILDRE